MHSILFFLVTATALTASEVGAQTTLMPSDNLPKAAVPASFVGAPCSSAPGVPTGGAIYYVSPQGDDGNDGLSAATAFQTIGHAFDTRILNPGDTVLVGPGLYNEHVGIGSAGAPGACITLMGMPGQALPVVAWSDDASATIEIWKPYIRVSRLAVTHPEPNFNRSATNNTGNSAIDVWGALATDAGGVWRPVAHHIQIDNNVAYGAGCGGISLASTDYALIYGNAVYANAFSDPGQCSGISIYEPVALDSVGGYHLLIVDNYSFSNTNIQPAPGQTHTTDGHGVIIDDSRQTQRHQPAPPQLPVHAYTGATLIFGNVIYNNGGPGIEIYSSGGVDVVNNTVYHDLNDAKLEGYPSNTGGEIDIEYAGHSTVENNIVVARAVNLQVISQYDTQADAASNLWTTNMTYGGFISRGSPIAGNIGDNTISGVDPLLLLTGSNANWTYRLHSNSPARGVGLPLSITVTDIAGTTVAAGGAVNIGAYQ